MRDTDLRGAERLVRPLVVAITVTALPLVTIAGYLLSLLTEPPSSPFALRDQYALVRTLTLCWLLLTLGTGALWVAWFRRLYRAAAILRPVRYPGGLAWLWAWFIPVVSWFVPKQMVNDVWRAGGGGPKATPPRGVQAWWALWVVGGLFRSGPGVGNPWFSLAATVVLLLPVPLAVYTVRCLTGRLRERYDALRPTEAEDPYAAYTSTGVNAW